MTTIITPELVRRYLRATGWTQDPTGEFWDRAEPLDGDTWFYADDVQRCLDGDRVDHLDRAVLGMLAAAEKARPPADRSEVDPLVAGSRVALMLDLIEAAGVDPEAWEATR